LSSSEKFKIVVVPPQGRGAWSLSVPRFAVPAFFAALIVLAGVLVAGSAALIRSAEGSLERARLARENELLKGRLRGMEEKIDALMAAVERNAEFEERLRLLADIEDAGGEKRRMGIGGPVIATEDPLFVYDPKSAALALDFEARLEELESECKYQQEDFAELLERLEEQREKWAHTPSISPVAEGWVTSGFGKRKDPFTNVPTMHLGVDFSAPKGTPVYATADGVVITAGWLRNFGRTVEIDHGNGIVTRYAHNQKIKVRRGQRVRRGQVIATVGRSGRATAPHVHYEVRVNGSPVNPWRYVLNSEVVVD